MDKRFKPYNLDQGLLLPPDLRDWLPEGHLALFVSDVVDALDLSAIYATFTSVRGQPPYHPAMMVKLLLYAYCTGKPSSRKIEAATHEDVAYRVLSANQHPDHDTIATFRKRQLTALSGLFLQVLLLCRKAGLVKLGHVALDGSKVKANASKHKAMSYERMSQTEKRLEAEVADLLAKAGAVDEAEDKQYGDNVRGDELPAELARRTGRLAKIREAKAALEQEAKDKAAAEAKLQQAKVDTHKAKEDATGKKVPGRAPKAAADPDEAVPEPKAQRNFTDPESRIMLDGATKGFIQAYNAQIVVDGEAQIIVATGVTQQANDKQQFVPMLKQVERNLGVLPEKVSVDSGYFSEANVTDPALDGVELFVPPSRQKHHARSEPTSGPSPEDATPAEKMRHALNTPEGRDIYRMRKAIVEPVFGQIKEPRGFRRFSLRGLEAVTMEWDFVCLTHNLLKLFRAQPRLHTSIA